MRPGLVLDLHEAGLAHHALGAACGRRRATRRPFAFQRFGGPLLRIGVLRPAGRRRSRRGGSRSGTRCPARAAPRVWRGARRSGGSRRGGCVGLRAVVCVGSWAYRSRLRSSAAKREPQCDGGTALKRSRSPRAAGTRRQAASLRFEPDFQAGLQAGLDELVEVAVEHLLRVAALDAGAQVLDAALVEHVVADLAAPADVGLGGFDRVASRRCASGSPARTAWPPASSSRCRGSGAGCGRSGRRPRCRSARG